MEKFNVYSFFQTLSVAEDAEYKTFDDWFTKFFKSNLDNLTEPELAYVYVSVMGLMPDLAGDGDAQAAGSNQQLTNANNFIDSAKELLLLTD